MALNHRAGVLKLSCGPLRRLAGGQPGRPEL